MSRRIYGKSHNCSVLIKKKKKMVQMENKVLRPFPTNRNLSIT